MTKEDKIKKLKSLLNSNYNIELIGTLTEYYSKYDDITPYINDICLAFVDDNEYRLMEWFFANNEHYEYGNEVFYYDENFINRRSFNIYKFIQSLQYDYVSEQVCDIINDIEE